MRETTIHYIDVVERRTDSASGHRQCVLGTNIHFDKSAIERATFRALEDQDIDLLVEVTRTRLGKLIRKHRDEWHGFLAQLPNGSWVRDLTFPRAA